MIETEFFLADNTDTGLLREIDEELRQEHYSKLWNRYGNYIIAAVILLILSVAGYKGWQSWDLSSRNDASNQFVAASLLAEQGNMDQAFEAFNAIIADAPAGYKLLARFRAASVLANEGDAQAAALAYQDIAADSSVQKDYRDLATLLGVVNMLDLGAPEELSSQLAPLTLIDSPWRYSAMEMSAILSLRSGDKMGAIDTLTELSSDQSTPAGVSSRASEMLSSLNAQ
jgi:hypothetical protein